MRFFNKINFKDKYLLLLLCLTTLIMCILYNPFIFHGQVYAYDNDIGSDTYQLILPAYIHFVDSVRSGTFSIWSFREGIGNESTSFDLFVLLLLFLKSNFIKYSLMIMLAAKLYIISLFMYKYLRLINIKNNYIIIICSLAWTFNGFTILWGQQYGFASNIAYFTVLLYALENLLRNKKRILFIIVIAIYSLCSLYFLYPATIFIFGYVLWNYFYNVKFNITKELLLTFVEVLKNYVLGILLTSFSFVLQLQALLSSHRVGGATRTAASIMGIIKSHNDLYFDFSTISRFFSNNIFGAGGAYLGPANYYELPMLSSSILILIFALYKVSLGNKKQVIMNFVLLALVILSLTNSFIPYILNGFSGVAYRWTYLIIFICIISGASGLEEFSKKPDINTNYAIKLITFLLIVALLAVGLTFLYNFLNTEAYKSVTLANNMSIYFNNIIFILGCFTLCQIFIHSHIQSMFKEKHIYRALLLVVVIEIIGINYATINDRAIVKSTDSYLGDSGILINQINENDNSFFRIDKYTDIRTQCVDSLTQRYYGLWFYSALNNPEYYNFSQQLGNIFPDNPNIIVNTEDYKNRKRLDDYLGVKYFIDGSETKPDDASMVYTKNNISAFINNDYYSFGMGYDKITDVGKVEDLSVITKTDALLDYAILDKPVENETPFNLYPNIDYKIVAQHDIEDYDDSISYYVKGNDPQVFAKLSGNESSNILVNADITVPKDESIQVYYSQDKEGISEKQSVFFKLKAGKNKVSIPLKEDNISNIRLDLGNDGEYIIIRNLKILSRIPVSQMKAEKSVFNVKTFKNTEITGDIIMKKDGILVFTLPYDNRWKIMVDGNVVTKLKVDFGMSGINLSSGKHDIKLYYVNNYFNIGLIISVLTIIFIVYLEKFRKKINIYKIFLKYIKK